MFCLAKGNDYVVLAQEIGFLVQVAQQFIDQSTNP